MRKFGELKGYQGDIKGKALVDYIYWIMPIKEKIWDMSSTFWSHDAGEITRHHSEKVKEATGKTDDAFTPFWSAYNSLLETLIDELELTDREKVLWEIIWEYKEFQSECLWSKYVRQFKEFHPILDKLTDEDNTFIAFWRDGYG